MKKYIVGGAVRDFLYAKLHGKLQNPHEINEYWAAVEKDWVVVGSTPEEMINLGFRPVGKSFPVFLDPDSNEEYALARTEKKVKQGYKGFICYAKPDVTLLEDLQRRDLTINAIAALQIENMTCENVIDPYGGINDLKKKLFRHVSPAFAEDPVRILRLARLATRFDDFSIDGETVKLMIEMVAAGEVDALVPERVWQEWQKSLETKSPWRFFEILDQCQAKSKLFPELSSSIPSSLQLNKKKLLAQAARQKMEPEIIFATALYGIEIDSIKALAARYRIPQSYVELALLVAQYFSSFLLLRDKLNNLSGSGQEERIAEQTLKFYQQLDAFRRSARFDLFLKTCFLLDKNQKGSLITLLQQCLIHLKKTDALPIISQKNLKGKEIGEAINKERIKSITAFLLNA